MKVLQKTNRNRDNDQEKICTTVSQNPPPNEKETSKKITKRNKTHHQNAKGYIY